MGGEVDVRYEVRRRRGGPGSDSNRPAYCALTMISLLGLPLELPSDAPARQSGRQTFGDGLPEYLSRCRELQHQYTHRHANSILQARRSKAAFPEHPRQKLTERMLSVHLHACVFLETRKTQSRGRADRRGKIQTLISLGRNLDVPMLIRWLSARQYAPEGGFSGRTNKLVDGCYSHWVGGCWPLLRAAMNQGSKQAGATLYSTEGLVRYILCCCQNEFGGLRDKPNK